jgi:hypothetical protein
VEKPTHTKDEMKQNNLINEIANVVLEDIPQALL